MRTYLYILAMAPRDLSEPIRFQSHEVQADSVANAYVAGQAHFWDELKTQVPDGWAANDYVTGEGVTPFDHRSAEMPPRPNFPQVTRYGRLPGADLKQAARDAFNILDGAACPVDDPEEWKRDVRRRLLEATR